MAALSSSSFTSSSSSSSSLYDAVEAGSLEKIEVATAAAAAAATNSRAAVNFLSDKILPEWDTDSYLGTGRGNSALHLACWKGLSSQIVDRLLELGADVHLKSSGNGFTALHCAACSGKVELATCLIDKGSNIHAVTNFGSNALHLASSHGRMEMAELLLNRGANIHERGNQGRMALQYAVYNNYQDLAAMLLDRGANIYEKADGGMSILQGASYFGHNDITALLLTRGAEIHAKGIFNDTALRLAKIRGATAIVNTLERWPVTMFIIIMQDLMIHNYLDVDSDLFQFIGTESDYVEMNDNDVVDDIEDAEH